MSERANERAKRRERASFDKSDLEGGGRVLWLSRMLDETRMRLAALAVRLH
jgi:hypothetical protein